MGTASITTATPEVVPAQVVLEAVAPVVLTVQSLLNARAELVTALRDASFEVRCVTAWDRLPEAVEHNRADIVLVDMDVVDRERTASGQLSGHRLVTLLARRLARRPTALVVMTRLDFAEIEDLARAGIHALIPPQTGTRRLVRYIQAALDRVRERHSRSTICPVDAVPLVDGAAPDTGAQLRQAAQLLQRFNDCLAIKQIAAPGEATATQTV